MIIFAKFQTPEGVEMKGSMRRNPVEARAEELEDQELHEVEQEDATDGEVDLEDADPGAAPKRRGAGLCYRVYGRRSADGEARLIVEKPTIGQARKAVAACRELAGELYDAHWMEQIRRIEVDDDAS